VKKHLLTEPTLKGYNFPDPLEDRLFEDIPEIFEKYRERFYSFHIRFSLFERAWTLRGRTPEKKPQNAREC